MTTQQILNMTSKELRKLNDAGLRSAVSVLRSTARKRYERIVENEVYSPAADYMVKSAKGGTVLPTVKGMTATELRNEFKRYKTFLNYRTSTVTGAKKAQAAHRATTEELVGRTLTDEEVTTLWQITGELTDSGVGSFLDYKTVANEVSNIIEEHPDFSDREILETARDRLVEIYESEQTASQIYPSQFM